MQGGHLSDAPVGEIQPLHNEKQKLIVKLLHADRHSATACHNDTYCDRTARTTLLDVF